MKVNLISYKPKYKEDLIIGKTFNFSKFTPGMYNDDNKNESKKQKFNYKNINFDSDYDDIDPIQTDNSEFKSFV